MDSNLPAVASFGIEGVGVLTLIVFVAVRIVALFAVGGLKHHRVLLVCVFCGCLLLFCAPEIGAILRQFGAGDDMRPDPHRALALLQAKWVAGVLAYLAGTITCQRLGLE